MHRRPDARRSLASPTRDAGCDKSRNSFISTASLILTEMMEARLSVAAQALGALRRPPHLHLHWGRPRGSLQGVAIGPSFRLLGLRLMVLAAATAVIWTWNRRRR